MKPKNSGNTLIYWKHFFLSSLRIIFFFNLKAISTLSPFETVHQSDGAGRVVTAQKAIKGSPLKSYRLLQTRVAKKTTCGCMCVCSTCADAYLYHARESVISLNSNSDLTTVSSSDDRRQDETDGLDRTGLDTQIIYTHTPSLKQSERRLTPVLFL